MAEMTDSEEDLFLTQNSSNGSINSGNEFKKLLASNNLEEDYENAQFNTEEMIMTEGLVSFDQAEE